jgi:hypothetical protein
MEETPSYWVGAEQFVLSKVVSKQPLGIWVTSVIWDNGAGGSECHLTFPKPAGTYPGMSFSGSDENASYLTAFSNAGQKVLLELEPADGDITTEIKLVLDRYSSYSCVAGISVDIEWIQPGTYSNGKAVTDAEASTWLTQIKSYNPNYLLSLVHWQTSKMPPTFRNANLILENDGLGHGSYSNMLSGFKAWGTYFSNANVGFIVGFDEDKSWFSAITDPVGTIMNRIFNEIPNCKEVFWASWTIPDIFTGTP